MLRTLELLRTMGRLGLRNVARVGTYRTLLRAGWYTRSLPVARPVRGPFFTWPSDHPRSTPEGIDAAAWAGDSWRVLGGEVPVFSHRWEDVGFPPRWHRSVLTGVEIPGQGSHWSALPDFSLPGGDVKGYWEAARFDGLFRLALGWLASGDERMRMGLETWIEAWAADNPANVGVHWKCAQETSLRLMALALVAALLERWAGVGSATGMHDLITQHCRRVSATTLYAMGQDNNHGTTEAAALFIGGSFLERAGGAHAGEGARWARTGRASLEERVARLFMPDGSFAQHSVNYHRMALDTLSLAETWRRTYGLRAFSAELLGRAEAATRWLLELTEPSNGDTPNLGANDGTRLFTMHRLPYRDHRPSVQWASALFLGSRSYETGPWDEPLRWLGLLEGPSQPPGPYLSSSRLMPDGGYARLSVPGAWALLRLPIYRFRPSHSDALHLDLWVDGENELRDGGSFSYNTDVSRWRYYTGVASHNTVELDGRDQMPRLSRFLFGRWLEPEEFAFDASSHTCSSSYRDFRGATHARTVHLEPGRCVVEDRVSGFERSAMLRWRLRPGRWDRAPGAVSRGTLRLAVTSDVPLARFELVEGRESRYYGHESALPVLEVEVAAAAMLRTEVTWGP